MKRGRDLYRLVAPVYELIEACYSGGAISACKRAQMGYLHQGQKVLFAGAGTAPEALWAAREGVRVTLLDSSAAMLVKAFRHFHKAGFDAPHCRHGDLASYQGEGPMDVVVANFFLNVFEREALADSVVRLSALLKPGGRLLIADFAPIQGKGLFSQLQKCYWYLPLHVANRITGEPIHPLHDYRPILEKAGLRVRESHRFRIWGFGPAWYQLTIADGV